MSWEDRLRNCSYTDPDGTVHALMFDDVARDGAKKVAAFDPPQQDRTEVQDLGMSGVEHGLTLYIVGDDYDVAADAFWKGLSLRHTDDNPGRLAHPAWGDLTVKPLTFSEARSFVEGMGRAIFTVQFKEVVTGAKFPALTTDSVGAIKSASDDTATTAIAGFIGPTTASDVAICTQAASDGLHALQNRLASVVAVSDNLAAALNSGVTQAVDTMGALIDAPATMAETIVGLMRLPAEAAGSITQKLTAYSYLFDDLASAAGFRSQAENDLLSLTLSASALAAAEAATAGDLVNRDDAVAASDSIAALLAYYRSMMDLTGPDGELVRQTVALLSTAQAYLLEASFSLKSARRKVLDHDSDPLTETWISYRDVSMLAQACKDNNLSDEEFYVLPMGREWLWYE